MLCSDTKPPLNVRLLFIKTLRQNRCWSKVWRTQNSLQEKAEIKDIDKYCSGISGIHHKNVICGGIINFPNRADLYEITITDSSSDYRSLGNASLADLDEKICITWCGVREQDADFLNKDSPLR